MRNPANKSLMLAAVLIGLLGLGSKTTWAQAPHSDDESSSKRDVSGLPSAPDTRADADAVAANADAAPADVNVPPRYVPSLNGDHLYTLGTVPRRFFLYGSDISEAYDGRINNTNPAIHGNLSIGSPFVGIMGSTERTQYIFQYSPTVAHFYGLNLGTQAFHDASLLVTSEFNRAWGWDFKLNSQYGVDALRLLSLGSFQAVSGVPVINPNSFILSPDLQNIVRNSALIDLRWRPSARSQLKFGFGHQYIESFATRLHSNYGDFRVDFEEAITQRFRFLSYGQVSRLYNQSQTVNQHLQPCTSYGGGLGVGVDVTRRVGFQVSAGPVLGVNGCLTGQGVAANGNLIVRTSQSTTIYVGYERFFNTPVVSTQTLSRDSLVAGFQKNSGRSLVYRVDGGYYRVGVCCGLTPFNGYFISPQVGYVITRSTQILLNYRGYYLDQTPQNLGRNQVLLTLEWRPVPIGISK
jgi:hypothetical protein